MYVRCPECKSRLQVNNALAGEEATCPRCQNDFEVPEYRPRGTWKNTLYDYFLFRKMVTSMLLTYFFWLFSVVALCAMVSWSIIALYAGAKEKAFGPALALVCFTWGVAFFGWTFARCITEAWIVFFRILDVLTDIKNKK